jgi:hypothetical protein
MVNAPVSLGHGTPARVTEVLLRSAATHDRAAELLHDHGQLDRAEWHRAAAQADRERAKRLQGALKVAE